MRKVTIVACLLSLAFATLTALLWDVRSDLLEDNARLSEKLAIERGLNRKYDAAINKVMNSIENANLVIDTCQDLLRQKRRFQKVEKRPSKTACNGREFVGMGGPSAAE